MRAEKQLLLDEIKEKINSSNAFILTCYQKMDPNINSQLRMLLLKAGGEMEVVAKRILVKAAAASNVTLDPTLLKGHIAVVFTRQDAVQTTKVIFKFKKENEDIIEIIGGYFEGRLYSAKDVEEISTLPNKQEMQAQFLGLLEATSAQTLGVFDVLLTAIIHCLDNKSKLTKEEV